MSSRAQRGIPDSTRRLSTWTISSVRWIQEKNDGVAWFRPDDAPHDLLVVFSDRGHAPENEPSPTAFLARRLASALGRAELAILRATQVHGSAAVTLREPIASGATRDAGECDVLATDRAGVALAVQTADCVPILLAGPGAVASAHAGWRGTARNVAAAAVAALRNLGGDPAQARVWLGPTIGACCYEVGGDVAAQFAGEFLRRGCGNGFLLDLKAVNVAQLEAAGVPRDSISVHSACTKCGGATFASYRRDGSKAGRMIALVARL
jgi:polyphenol oxidase